MSKTGVYRAHYIVATAKQVGLLVSELAEGVLSGFGSGSEQWSGLDITDEGGSVSVTWYRPLGMYRVDVTCLVHGAEPDYWLSPATVDGVHTFNDDGSPANGEAADWGLYERGVSNTPLYPEAV